MSFRKNEQASGEVMLFAFAAVVLLLLAAIFLFGYPQYKIYKLEQNGKAQLAEAEWTKKIAVEDAKAGLESAKINRETELIKANTLADSNKIVRGSIDELYIKYLMVNKLTDGNTQQVIYIPTEAGIPILEAGRTVNSSPATS